MMNRFKQLLPNRERLLASRWLRWLGPLLHHPQLWHWSRRGVSMGVAIGVFFGLLIPFAQIPFSATAAVLLRANLPAAAASTLVTNPVTFGPIYYGAYRLGVWVTGSKEHPKNIDLNHPQSAVADKDASFWQRITNLGKPLLVGLALSAVMMGLLTYALISLIWRWRTVVKRRGRMRAPPS
ncbi:MAG: DUF2062 domain-containing protein [Rhodoferax sp.]|uniref:DUF2062 domain-containing protein n=1 Tax=Rhodoferax sp. TaxID=50421 RepID=UPI00272FB45B|nr:DUF2062 domain-containing protein [Rhodoferax sp.]MDP1529772.1 DUF2062 domain-containing protein [Rhodoferax sp.]